MIGLIGCKQFSNNFLKPEYKLSVNYHHITISI